MKKEVLVLAIISILLISISLGLISAKDSKKDKIEQKVLDKANKEGKVRVIVKLKDNKKAANSVNSLSEKVGKEKISHKFSSGGFSASLTAKEIEDLANDNNVESIYYDRPVSIDLQDSVPLINATNTWKLQDAGINLTGKGQTVCIIDTGVDYTHPDLGNCTPVKLILNGSVENLTIPVESAHNYADNFDYTWTIMMPGYSQIAVHFRNLTTETNFDQVEILDNNSKFIAIYSGSHPDIWSASAVGDTIKIRLITYIDTNYYGFYIDQVINGTTNTTYDWSNCSKVIGGWDVRNSDGDPKDDQGHGTHVAGIVAANGAIKGVAPDAKIIAIKALSSGAGSGTTSDVVAGIEWCTTRNEDFNISVISMSLGASCYNSTGDWSGDCFNTFCDSADALTSNAINSATEKNISVIIAAGNDGNESYISYPACMQNAIPVSATTKADVIDTSYSNRNWMVQLVAPGTNINSTQNGGGYTIKQGTSMATPHAAGAIVIINQFLKLQGDSRNPQEIESALNRTGRIINDAGSGLNFSRINIYDAIMALDSVGPSVTLISPSSNYINNTATSLNLTFRCNATDFIMKNMTFYLWNETDVYNSSSKIVSGANGVLEVNISNLSQGDYAWNCLAYDNSSNPAFASSNYSVSYDLEAPNISLLNPTDGYITTSTTNSFDFNVLDDVGIANCGLIVDDAIVQYNSSAIIKGSTNSISYDLLAIGNYVWSINCTDNAGNKANSSSRSIEIISPYCGDGSCNNGETCSSCSTDCGSCSSGGGGGGGGLSYSTFSATESELLSSYQKEMKKLDVIKFKIGAQNHTLTVDYIGENSLNITLHSNPIKISLTVGEEKKINLTSPDYYDFVVRLDSIAGAKANITIRKIYELINPPAEEKPALSTAATEPIAPATGATKNNRELTIQNTARRNTNSTLQALSTVFGFTFLAVIVIVIAFYVKQYSRQEELRRKVRIRR